jgi:hypothetical protein
VTVLTCEQGCDRPAEVPMLVDYGSIFEPPVKEMWCAECAAQQIVDELEAWGNPTSPDSRPTNPKGVPGE